MTRVATAGKGRQTSFKLLAVLCCCSLLALGLLDSFLNTNNFMSLSHWTHAPDTVADKLQRRADRLHRYLECVSTTGQWVMDRSLKPYYTEIKATDGEAANVDPTPSSIFWWKTSDECSLQQWDPEQFCRVLSGRNILIIGDSLSGHFHLKLNIALSGYSDQEACPGDGVRICSQFGFEVQSTCSYHVRNDRLSLRNDTSIDTGSNFYEYPWLWLLERLKDNDILVFNKGAHFEADDVYMDKLKQTMAYLNANTPPTMLKIWRNTVGGHGDCGKYTEPIQQRQSDPLPYEWDQFPRQNKLAEDYIRNHTRNGFITMDVETMTALRPDHHLNPPSDCLHYVVDTTPSPVDFWVLLFHNILLFESRDTDSPIHRYGQGKP